MKLHLTRAHVIFLARAYPTFESNEIIELINYIEEVHTIDSIKAMMNDGGYIEPAMRTFYDEVIATYEPNPYSLLNSEVIGQLIDLLENRKESMYSFEYDGDCLRIIAELDTAIEILLAFI